MTAVTSFKPQPVGTTPVSAVMPTLSNMVPPSSQSLIAQKSGNNAIRNALTGSAASIGLANSGRKRRDDSAWSKAVDPSYKQTMQLSGGRQVNLRARNDGTLLIDIPDRFNLQGKAVSLNLLGVNKVNSPNQVLKAVEKLCINVDRVPYVYGSDRQPKYNDGGAGGAKEVRQGLGWLVAHGGDREAKPANWKEPEWENSIQSIYAARMKGAIPELDVQWNKNGELFLHHDGIGRKIDANGKPQEVWNDERRPVKDASGNSVLDATGKDETAWVRGRPRARVPTTVNIRTGDLKEVDKVAERLGNVLSTFPPKKNGKPSFFLEMKKGIASPAVMAEALYAQLKKSNRLTDVVITSMHSEMLTAMHDLATADRVPLKLMKVLGLHEALDKGYVNNLKESTPYIRYVGFPTDYGGNRVSKDDVDYAKRQGLYAVGWNWDPTDDLKACSWSTKRANALDLDAMMTDCINNLKESRPEHWKLATPP